ncbi:MAG: peroxide stress protein YaaA [Corynebacterium sp.]|nr:peroxide stress protein YaaA [Corynebacterium sp.]
MLIILPPSETKASGGDNPPLDFDSLSYPALNSIRAGIASQLSQMPIDVAMSTLGLSEKLRDEARANTELLTSPTMPALLRYTGVLFDALSAATLPSSAWDHLVIGSALFGVVGARDLIPRYRLSGSTKLGGKTLKSLWKSAISDELDSHDFVVDLRSGVYQQLGKTAAVTVRVENRDGKVISHFNKHYKGELARELALHPVSSVAEIQDLPGFNFKPDVVVRGKQQELTLVVDH